MNFICTLVHEKNTISLLLKNLSKIVNSKTLYNLLYVIIFYLFLSFNPCCRTKRINPSCMLLFPYVIDARQKAINLEYYYHLKSLNFQVFETFIFKQGTTTNMCLKNILLWFIHQYRKALLLHLKEIFFAT